jgi:hypothetical protein
MVPASLAEEIVPASLAEKIADKVDLGGRASAAPGGDFDDLAGEREAKDVHLPGKCAPEPSLNVMGQ